MVSSTETGDLLGVFIGVGEDDPDAPPHKGEGRQGLWFPRRKPEDLLGVFWRIDYLHLRIDVR